MSQRYRMILIFFFWITTLLRTYLKIISASRLKIAALKRLEQNCFNLGYVSLLKT